MQITGFELIGTEQGLDPTVLPHLGWAPAVVPGGVHESLLAAGRIASPYWDRQEEDARWIEDRDWWFRASFAASQPAGHGERARLVFHGLDTVVDIWLNGSLLGHHENMFRPAEFDVTDRLEAGNELLLRFSPPLEGLEMSGAAVRMAERLAKASSAAGAEDGGGESTLTAIMPFASQRRKAAFSWGWDFGPRLPSIGIWRPVELLVEREAVVIGHHIRTDALQADGSALVNVLIEVDRFATEEALTARVELTAPSGLVTTVELPVENGIARGTVIVREVELWWSHDLGTPTLYEVRIVLLDGETVLHHIGDRVGLRTIALDRGEDPEGGRRFRFVLNGTPIFARGAAWLPADMLVGSVAAERYRELVGLARDAGMNMLRVWGGGIYEQDAFYQACDELGVLVWQDFMFACIDYPSDDPVLLREVELEAKYQVTRLRNRASLAIWAGNNEVQVFHGLAYGNYEPGSWGYDFFYRVLPNAVAAHDGAVPYWPGSPWGEDPSEGVLAANGVLDGDRHAWEVWHGLELGAGGGPYASVGESRHYRRYANDRGKFISEFGIHASPELSTLRRWLPEEALEVHSPSFDQHNKDNPKDKHDAVLEIVTGIPQTIEHYVDRTMISQAEGLKFGVEHYRRRQPHCSGTLVWQFNDVWPGFSWSVVDHDLVPKASYHYLSRAYVPVLTSFRVQDGALQLWVTNSGRTMACGTAVVTLATFAGREELRETIAFELEPGQSQAVWSGADLPLTVDRYAWAESPDGLFPSNRLFFGEIKELPLGTGSLDVVAEATGPATARLTITASGFAYFVHVLTPARGVRFSDNYVDLRDGDRVVIDVSGLPEGYDPAQLSVNDYPGDRRDSALPGRPTSGHCAEGNERQKRS